MSKKGLASEGVVPTDSDTMLAVDTVGHTAVNVDSVETNGNGTADFKVEDDSISFDPIEDIETAVEAGAEDRIKVALEWANLHFSVRQKKEEKRILNGISGDVQSGQMLAIMGASGAGKTSLLNLLAGRLTSSKNYKSSGKVLVNGKKRNYTTFKKFSAYVMQDDDMFAELSVREHITFSAMLRLPPDMPVAAKEERVSKIIQELGLKKVEHTRIGNAFIRGVSGGERKRVNIGVELVTDPSLIFLDEPTSGLDSFNALNVMLSLRHLCRNGRTVVTTIHQPRSNIFNLFDNLLLLSDGKTMYFGKADAAVNYFGGLNFQCPAQFNPADYFIDLLSHDTRLPNLEHKSDKRIEYLADQYLQHEEKVAAAEDGYASDTELSPQQKTSADEGEKFSSSWYNELYYLTARNIKLITRERQSNMARFMQNLVFSILLGLIWLNVGRDWENDQSNNAYAQALLGILFFMTINQAFGSVFGVIFLYPLERSVVLRERASGTYRVLPYHISKIVSELPRTLFFTFEFAIIVYWMVGLKATAGAFFLWWIITILTVLITESMALCVSTMLPNPQTASAVMPVFIILAMLFSGFFISVNTIPSYIAWGQYLSYIKYSFAAAAENQFQGSPGGDAVLSATGLNDIALGANIAILVGFYLFWRSLLYVILRFDKPKFDRTL